MVLKYFLLVASALIPALGLVYFFYKRDKLREPRSVLIKTFLLGMAIVGPLIPLGMFTELLGSVVTHPLASAAFVAFVGAAIPEEVLKYLVLTRWCVKHPAFDEPMDGIVYGATASLGFAGLENVMYVAANGYGTAIARALTAVPAHACFGAIMGYYVGMAEMGGKPKTYRWIGLFFAVLLHGFYDFPLFLEQALEKSLGEGGQGIGMMFLLVAGFATTLVGMVVWTLILVQRSRKRQI